MTTPFNQSALRLRAAVRLTVAPFGHELIEFGLVLGEAKPIEEIAELALLLFEPLERFGPIIFERTVAARRRAAPVAAAEAVHPGAKAIHPSLQAGHLAFPTIHAVMAPATGAG